MSATSEPRLPFEAALPDQAAREAAVDPSRNVVLEASAGTGKTRVLVERYVNLVRAGVDPDHILAVTFTRKAAAEMRLRIIDRLKEASRLSEFDAARWRELKECLGDIAIMTIDAFCLSLLREFPLGADVDPGFDLVDDTEAPRLIGESLDAALRICRSVARDDEDVALVFAQIGERRLRTALAALLDRRLAAPHALSRFLANGPRGLTAAVACQSAANRLRHIFASVRGGLEAFLDDGPIQQRQFSMLAGDIRAITRPQAADSALPSDAAPLASPAAFRNFIDRLRAYFLTQEGKPRAERFAGTGFSSADCDTEDAWKRHRRTAAMMAPAIAETIRGFRRDLNVVLARGVWRIFAVALRLYQQNLDARGLLDFPGLLERAIRLLRELDEFSESRFRLESRYRHVLVDEFQDTSRAQWELVRQLVRSWGEGVGASEDAIPPSIFVVGDRKQSIYGFRDADVSIIEDAGAFIEGLRPWQEGPRQAITASFRSAPAILSFVNELFDAIAAGAAEARRDGFRYASQDRFSVEARAAAETDESDGQVTFVARETVRAAAASVAHETVQLLAGATVRDRVSGLRRRATPADIAVLFRSRESHREFETALESRGVPTYVYRGLGFFEADEIQDLTALLRYLADPWSDLRTAALLRSRLVGLSDVAIAQIGPCLADAILGSEPVAVSRFDAEDRRALGLLRSAVPGWLERVDRQTPSELFDGLLRETAYAYELRGSRRLQARENVKKLRSLVRRAQNRGYATLARIAEHLDDLAVGDESNAAVDAVDAVSLMTVHAAKGLEFPIVFVVNMGRGTGGLRQAVRISEVGNEASVAVADYQSEADDDAQAREREETKRLLYVALTRARDRLFLSATVRDGKCRMGRGSLGEVLPERFRAMFVAAATAADEGPTRESRPSARDSCERVAPPLNETDRVTDDFEPLL